MPTAPPPPISDESLRTQGVPLGEPQKPPIEEAQKVASRALLAQVKRGVQALVKRVGRKAFPPAEETPSGIVARVGAIGVEKSEHVLEQTREALQVQKLFGQLSSLGEDKKLVLTKSGDLEVSKQRRNLFSSLFRRTKLKRTGASAKALKAADRCLQHIKDLSTSTGENPALRQSLLALVKSQWFRGVVHHHPEISGLLHKTVEQLRPDVSNSADCDNFTGFTAEFVSEIRDVKELSQLIKPLSSYGSPEELSRQIALISKKIDAAKFTAEVIQLSTLLAEIKRRIDSLAASSPKEARPLYTELSLAVGRLSRHSDAISRTIRDFLEEKSREGVYRLLSDALSLTTAPFESPSSSINANPVIVLLRAECARAYGEKAAKAIQEASTAKNAGGMFAIAHEIHRLPKGCIDSDTREHISAVRKKIALRLVEEALTVEDGQTQAWMEASIEFPSITEGLTEKERQELYTAAAAQISKRYPAACVGTDEAIKRGRERLRLP